MTRAKVWFLGAGPGAADLLTVRAARALAEADVVVWGKALMTDEMVAEHARADAELVPWPPATIADIHAVYDRARDEDLVVARLLWGDPAIYATTRDEVREARARELDFEIVPGVSAFCAAAAALEIELTRAPKTSQSLIITAPSAPEPLRDFARHGATIAIFMAGRRGEDLQTELLAGGYAPQTQCAIAHRVTRDGEVVITCRLDELSTTLVSPDLDSHTLVLVGAALADDFGRT
ncbi:MAG: cobalt-precorrin-4/precorrin-4 C(11)-methyltransferase [Solirubrobacterales bacterium]|nr:cobalt-precorrin-4/precorrin-4 C(11)-methyltransferase [Solirubrobacterales bacterium]